LPMPRRMGPQLFAQAAALYQLHHQIRAAVLHEAEVINGDDVRVFQFRGGAGLAVEPFGDDLVGEEFGAQDLDRDVAFELLMDRPIDRPHAAVSDQPLQAVLAVDDDRKLIDEKCGSLIEEAILRAVSETTMTNLTIPHWWRPSWTISGDNLTNAGPLASASTRFEGFKRAIQKWSAIV